MCQKTILGTGNMAISEINRGRRRPGMPAQSRRSRGAGLVRERSAQLRPEG